MHDDKLNRIISRLVHSTDSDEIRTLYKEWAGSYETDLADFGYVAPQVAVEILSELLPDRQSLIYDAGCGTGLVGQLLAAMGYSCLHGADFSSDMLDQARLTDVYTRLTTADYSKPMADADSVYDGIISVGVYTARFNGCFIPGMLRILKPEGVFVFTCRPHYFVDDVEPELHTLASSGKVQNLQIELKPYILGQNADAYYISMQKNL